ncbi:MAG: copper homeostasis protein CutC [Gemmatimonadota bacterium]
MGDAELSGGVESLTLVEAYVDELATAVAAAQNGAGRLELCGPGEGGLTPSPALLREVLAAVRIPVHVMVRPRTGDFVYTAEEFAAMREGIAMAKAAGATGVVFGITHADGTLDVTRMAELVALARPLRVGIHRAFDRAPDPEVALDQVIALGLEVVLTSGHAESAEQGIPTLARLVTRAAGRTVILAGGGVRAPNVRRIIRETGVYEVHARASDPEVFAAVVRAAHAV